MHRTLADRWQICDGEKLLRYGDCCDGVDGGRCLIAGVGFSLTSISLALFMVKLA